MTTPELPPPLPDDVLARRRTLPLKPAPVTLAGQMVRLEPLDLDRDIERLHAISNGQPVTLAGRSVDAYDADEHLWRFMLSGPFESSSALADHLRAQVNAPNGLPFTVFHAQTGEPLGVANYMSNLPDHLKIELGSIWYSPAAQGTGANTEATYLMLRHAFALGYRRVEWKCNALNERSRESALKMGFQFEGIQESHFIIKGRNRDTAWFRVLDHEWDAVRARLERRLYGD